VSNSFLFCCASRLLCNTNKEIIAGRIVFI
jgi:hypothetical protein